MNNELLNISLNQGKQFNKYQSKIKKKIKISKEGFTNESDKNILTHSEDNFKPVVKNQRLTITENNKQLNKLQNLQNEYQDLLQQYNQIQKSLVGSSLEEINRTSANNKYLNKNIKFTDGTICYVTSLGIAKPYPSLDIFNKTSGKNGCPTSDDVIILTIPWLTSYVPGSIIPTNPTLIVGDAMMREESCGYEGKNIYVSSLINNPNSNYIGCYNDIPNLTNINIIPIMNSSNNVNGFISTSSSVYLSNNDTFGPWAALDQNSNTYWSSETLYNSETGLYEGANSISSLSGEYLAISLPGINTVSSQLSSINQYSLTPSSNTGSSPNSWYILGYNNNQWVQIDRQVDQQFTSSLAKVYSISDPNKYSGFCLLVDKVGPNIKSVQIAEWNLYSNVLSTNAGAMIIQNSNSGTFEQCQQYAIDNSYQYFAYQSNGLATCSVSNDLSTIKMYGDSSIQINAIPVWSTNTIGFGSNTCYISSLGQMILTNSSGTNTWNSPNAPIDCINLGYVNPDTIQGSFGGNCVGKPLNIDCGNPSTTQSYGTEGIVGNLNDLLYNKATSSLNNSLTNWIYNPLTDWTKEDPAYCCAKTVNYSYQCGGNAYKSGEISGGSNINFDCSQEVSNCIFFLILQDDGNLCLYRGTDPSDNRGSIWCASTNGSQKSINPDWVASKGKYGRNYLKNNETLAAGEWMGSNDGSMKLIMQTDGNLVLYTSETKPGCTKDNNGKYYGEKNVNAVYEINAKGNKSNLGKVAYIDSNSKLREYPSSMLGYSNEYQLYQGTDSGGNDITSLQASTIDDCKNNCDNVDACAAFVYQANTSTCWLKNSNAYPVGEKQNNNSLVLGVRKPSVAGSSSCPNTMVNVDTIQYDNYAKGPNLNVKTNCNANLKPVSKENMDKYNEIKNNLFNLGQKIASEMETLYNQDNKIYEKLNMNSEQFKKNISMYKNINDKINSNNMEGMQNMKRLNITDINGMLSDTDIRVLQENYSYIFWSILAVGLITVAINTMKK
uniref:Apple domain-containing protein n=1 Tax=viral metagenome TaxID=1070528 RepID=A0A6C0KRR4_9ZZZZ